jgi:DNA-binding NarL/FixJ family response regulator
MFSSRVLGAAKTLGLECRLLAQPQQIAAANAGDCRLALIDLTLQPLDLPTAVAAIRAAAPQARIVAFGPHVDEALLGSAKDAGCDLVWARSQFHKQYVELLTAAANA